MQTLINIIDIKLMVLIIISSYWGNRYFKKIIPKMGLTFKIFIWSTILSFVYFHIGKELGIVDNNSVIDLLITYFTATSFYELAFKPLENLIKYYINKIKVKENEK